MQVAIWKVRLQFELSSGIVPCFTFLAEHITHYIRNHYISQAFYRANRIFQLTEILTGNLHSANFYLVITVAV